MNTNCDHTCKGLCNALDLAIELEEKSLIGFRAYANECDYPDVKILLNDLIANKEKSILQLKDKAEMIRVTFNTLDQISAGFED